MAFDASKSPEIIDRATDIFMGKASFNAEFAHPHMSLKKVIQSQTAQTVPTFEDERCVSVKAWFYTDGQDSVTHDGTTPVSIP